MARKARRCSRIRHKEQITLKSFEDTHIDTERARRRRRLSKERDGSMEQRPQKIFLDEATKHRVLVGGGQNQEVAPLTMMMSAFG
jgi:hypothetical protein